MQYKPNRLTYLQSYSFQISNPRILNRYINFTIANRAMIKSRLVQFATCKVQFAVFVVSKPRNRISFERKKRMAYNL